MRECDICGFNLDLFDDDAIHQQYHNRWVEVRQDHVIAFLKTFCELRKRQMKEYAYCVELEADLDALRYLHYLECNRLVEMYQLVTNN